MLGIRSAHGLCQTGYSCANPRRIEPEVRIVRAMFVVVVAMCILMVPVVLMVLVVIVAMCVIVVPVVLVVIVAMCVIMVPMVLVVIVAMGVIMVSVVLVVIVAMCVIMVPMVLVLFLVAMGILGTSHRQVGQGIDELFQANHDRLVGPRLLEQLIKPTGLQSHANHDYHIGVGHTRDILGPGLEHVHIAPGGHK